MTHFDRISCSDSTLLKCEEEGLLNVVFLLSPVIIISLLFSSWAVLISANCLFVIIREQTFDFLTKCVDVKLSGIMIS